MTENVAVVLQRLSEGFHATSSTVAQRVADTATVMQSALNAEEFARWLQSCLQVAQSGWRSWESAEAFIQASPFLWQCLAAAQFWQWTEQGQRLARSSAEAASAFFRAAKPFLQQTSQERFAFWVEGGQWYLKHYPASPSLAVEYFRLSPAIYAHYAATTTTLWDQLGHAFVKISAKYLQAFFALSQMHVEHTPEIDPTPAWTQASRMLPQAVEVALAYCERYGDFVQRFGEEGVEKIQTILNLLLTSSVAEAKTFLRLVSTELSFIPNTERLQVLTWCEAIARRSRPGVLAFIQHVDALRRHLPGQRLQPWIDTGLELVTQHPEAGEAYFAVESAAAQDCLHTLRNVVVFPHIEPVLQLYAEALLGRKIPLRPTTELPEALQSPGRDLPTSDGSTIYVPPQVDTFATPEDNFAAYKVAVLHQIGFYESGTFRFRFAEMLARLPQLQQTAASALPAEEDNATTSLSRFFATFAHPQLARTLFTILEDARIDAAMARRYKGMRPALQRMMLHSLQQRPNILDMPLRQALLEALLQCTLGGLPSPLWPPTLYRLVERLGKLVTPLHGDDASVYDTAQAVFVAYILLTQIPTSASTSFSTEIDEAMQHLVADLADDEDAMALADMFQFAGEGADSMPTLPESQEAGSGIEPVPYRGDLKPELIEKKLRLDELAKALDGLEEHASPLPPEVLKELLENNAIDLKSLQSGELNATSGLFVSDLEGKEGLNSQNTLTEAVREEIEALRTQLQDDYGALAPQKKTFLYDEWDYLIGDYRRGWCRLSETVLADEGTEFVEETRQRYADLLAEVYRQFQMLKPELFQKIKRLPDGEDIDLDSAIEAVVDRRAGNLSADRVYMRRNKRDRSVAAAFLLDMSASTDDEVPDTEEDAPAPAKPRKYDFSGFVQDDYYAILPPRKPDKERRRIIDIEKEALILMAEALEGLGDAYAVYGFSGYGRDQVDAFIVKEFHEPYNARIQGRIGAMKPHRSTRMGPAIRHALRKLERQEARLKTLLLLSDGYPQDFDYGKDRKSKEYGIQDTMMALHEARLKGILTFCITVDPGGHDYLRTMCPDQQYLVIENITELPKELPKVYRGLTT